MGELPKLPRDWLSPCCFPRVVENKRVKKTIYGRFVGSTGEFKQMYIYRGHIWAAFHPYDRRAHEISFSIAAKLCLSIVS